jgi:hypothetical protein
MQKLLKYIILVGIFILPLISSRITSLLWFSFSMPVDWNYEFTKVMFFNIWSSLIIVLFCINNIFSRECRPVFPTFLIIFFYIFLSLSTFFSESPIISFLWNNEKSHSFLMWSNLIWLFLVFRTIFQSSPSLYQRESNNGNLDFNQIIKTFIFSWIFVSFIWIKEYFLPTFNYGDLWNRLFSTFWHPNYLSIFLLSLIPFLYNSIFSFQISSNKGRGIKGLILLLFIFTLILTKSFIAIFLFLIFNLYYFWNKIKYKKFLISLITLLLFSLIYIYLPEKLHSFISRYFLWEATVKTIFSDIKMFLIWWWTETLMYFFDNFKSKYVYIFENLWYTADRPHNIFLNFFYHFWIFGLVFILGIYYKVFNFSIEKININYVKLLEIKISLILIFIFLLFNPTSIVIYLISTILLAQLFYKDLGNAGMNSLLKNIFILSIIIFSIFWAYNSYKFYISEANFYKKDFIKALEWYKYNQEIYFMIWKFEKWLNISKIKTQQYYFYKIRSENSILKKNKICSEFLKNYNYAENYFYCWSIFWDNWREDLAKNFYKKWIDKLPDLWNENSIYYRNLLVKTLKINSHRLTSEKYGLKLILNRIE